MGKHATRAFLATSVAFGVWSAAQAQDPLPTAPASPAGANRGSPAAQATSVPEEVVVTAQKRSQKLQNVAAQVDVITPRVLEALHIEQTPDIVQTIPNLTVARNDTARNSTIVLRGITQANDSDVPVAVIVDGVPQDDAKQFNTNLFDISQIEVLKGPQGSLYGRNAEAGAIIITTEQPTNTLKGFANVSYGNGNTVDGSVGVSGPLVPDRLLFRLSGNYSRSDGLIRNTTRDDFSDYVDHDRSIRGDLKFILTDRVTLDLTGQYEDFKSGTTWFSPVFSGNSNQIVDPQSNFPGVDVGRQAFLSAKLQADLSFATLTSVSGFTKITEHQISDVDFTGAPGVGDNQPSNNNIFSQELRLVGPAASRFRWLVSGDYLTASQLLSTNIFLDEGRPSVDPFNPNLLLVSSAAQNERSGYGASGQVDYDLLKDLTLTAGLRYDNDDRNQKNLNADTNRQKSFDQWQPKFTASYKVDPNALLYGTYSVGFRSGGFNQPNYAVPIFGAETLRNFEVGFKTEWLNRTLTINGDAFTGNVSGYQYSFIDFKTGSPVTGNIDRVRVSGGELETRWTPLTGLSLFGNVGVAIPIIQKFSASPSFVGNQSPRAQDLTLQGGVDYKTPITDQIDAFFRSNVQYNSKTYWYIDNLATQKPKVYLNFSGGLTRGNYTLTLWAKNVLNTRAYDTYDPSQATGLPYDVGLLNKPATYGVEMSVRY